jgi:flagellar biosynthesis GTPase FlhF
MIIKSFTGPTVAAALKLVRDAMGGDAIVLKTRILETNEIKSTDDRVEVTVCIDESVLSPGRISEMFDRKKVPQVSLSRQPNISRIVTSESETPDDLAVGLEKKLNGILCCHGNTEPLDNISPALRSLFLDLLDSDISIEIARQLIETIEGKKSSRIKIRKIAQKALVEYLEKYVALSIHFAPGTRIVFAGPSGAGKTSALAKLAVSLVSVGLKVTLSSLDDMKVSAYEEMESYADILNLPAVKFDELDERRQTDSIVLIDTPPLPAEPGRRMELVKRINAARPDITFLVFSVCNRSRDLLDAINHFEAISANYLIATHLDETARWGAIYTMAGFLEIPLIYTVDSPGGIGDLSRVDSARIACSILKTEVTNEDK